MACGELVHPADKSDIFKMFIKERGCCRRVLQAGRNKRPTKKLTKGGGRIRVGLKLI